MKGILGKKVGMTQVYDQNGEAVPVTVIEAGPCFVTQIKTKETDGYDAIQIGYGETKEQRLTQPQRGHLAKAGAPLVRHLREFRVNGEETLELGQRLDASVFEVGDVVDVTGTSKGKGFAGVIKRHNFQRQRKTHGQSDRERAPGSLGAGSTPGRVFKGKRMAGRMGNDRVTVQNLSVVLVDPERNILAIKGSVPGAKNGLVTIRQAVKA
ncbi:MAG: 50S ribosomal protein L3 [Anaerolineales bacterium]|nr:50S ribosomal protein L3 [Anaerolineales bacterium]MCB9127195.1 50S ribosomal protein L3 [Ardenticatenales bacterium]MCB9171951.1 50S ribosomal protein L3 [Ardenticatenales bacterium]